MANLSDFTIYVTIKDIHTPNPYIALGLNNGFSKAGYNPKQIQFKITSVNKLIIKVKNLFCFEVLTDLYIKLKYNKIINAIHSGLKSLFIYSKYFL